ncbi:MAG: hypothetical protein ACKVX7_09740 [Planctomycetota bacterium]
MRRSPELMAILGSLGVAVLGFLLAAIFMAPLASLREDLRPQDLSSLEQEIPPEIAISQTALGSFRGIGLIFLMLRATELQDEGRYHEAARISDWVTTLAPRYEWVWTFHSHNLAFNIAATSFSAAERWMWVSTGIELLRGRGLVINPLSAKLHNELQFYFTFKIEDEVDDFHEYYQDQLAREWERVLGAPPPNADSADLVAWFRPIADAPHTKEALAAAVPALAEVLSQLTIDADLLALMTGPSLAAPRNAREKELASRLRPLREIALALPAGATALDALIAHTRGAHLRRRYHMDPELMLDLMEQIGPLDWRTGGAHGCYWAIQGELRKRLKQPKVRLGADGVPLGELLKNVRVLGSLIKLVEAGRVVYCASDDAYSRLPDPRFLPAYEVARFQGLTLAECEDYQRTTYQILLTQSTLDAYFAGESQLAAGFFERLARHFSVATELESFIDAQLWLQITSDASVALEESLTYFCVGAYSHGLAVGRPDIAERFRVHAQRIHAERGAATLPPLAELELRALRLYLQTSSALVPLAAKARVWRAVAPELIRQIYEQVIGFLADEARRAGLDVEQLFPRR